MSWQLTYRRQLHDFSALPFKYPQLSQLIKITPQVSGPGVRLVLQNLYGSMPLTFDRILISHNESMQDAQPITRARQPVITIPKQAAIRTDALEFEVKAGQPLYILMQAQNPQMYADFGSIYDETYFSAATSAKITQQLHLPHRLHARKSWFCLNQIEVWSDQSLPMLELTGDSLMETGMIEAGLINRLSGQAVVTNSGILGNRLLHDAINDEPLYQTFGQALKKRLQLLRDSQPHQFVVTIGTNDLALPLITQADASQLIRPDIFVDTMISLHDEFKQKGHELFFTSIVPFNPVLGDQKALMLAKEQRLQINEQLRRFDWVIDVEPLLFDTMTGGIKPAFDFGDQLHLNHRGGDAVAERIYRDLVDK